MSVKDFFTGFSLVFLTAFAVTMIVTYLYSLVVHGHGEVNWETVFELSLILGILIPFTERRTKRVK